MRWCVVALGLCGCDAVFGIDPVGAPITIRGSATQHYLYLDPSGPILEESLPATSPLAAHDRRGNELAVAWDRGSFSFEAAEGERYSLLHQTAITTIEYQLAVPTIALEDTVLGHPDPEPPGAGAGIEWDTTETGLSYQDLRFATVGVWSQTTPAAMGTGRFVLPASATTYYQRPALLRSSEGDGLIVMHIKTSTGVTPVNRTFDRFGAFRIDQLPDAMATVSATLVDVPRPYCDDIAWLHTRDHARFTQLYPAFAGQGADTRLWAIPHANDISSRAVYELALVFSNQGDSHFTFMYGNPFGFDVVVLDNAYALRTLSNGTVIGVYTQYFAEITPSTTCDAHLPVEPPAPLIVGPTLGGVPLADNVVIGSDGVAPIELRWTIDTPSPGTLTQVNVLQGASLIRQYVTLDESITIDPRDLVSGTPYRLMLVPSVGNYPNAASGDFRTRGFPISQSIYSTGLFSIAKP